MKVSAELPSGPEILVSKTAQKIWLSFLALKVLSSEDKTPVHLADLTIHHSGPFLPIVVMLLEDTEDLEILEVISGLFKNMHIYIFISFC